MNKVKAFCILTLFFSLITYHTFSQTQGAIIHLTGSVYDPENSHPDLTGFMIVNLRTQNGFFGKADGSFSFDIDRNDSLIVAAFGYEFVKIRFRDSVFKPDYQIRIALKKKLIILPEVRIIAPRDLEAIQKDIQKLGYRKEDYELSGIDALQSPITFLYEQFSRREQLKRHNAQMVNDDKKRKLLKELLTRYVADGIIKLNDEAFDHFIDFCNISEDYLKKSSQYDFMVYIKNRYELFEEMNDYYRK